MANYCGKSLFHCLKGINPQFPWCLSTDEINRSREGKRESQTRNLSEYVSQLTDQLVNERFTVRRIHH